MTAPPRPRWREAELELAEARAAQARAVSAAHAEAVFARAVEEWAASVPYTRPGEPSGLLMTGAQWELYDEWQELASDMDRKHDAMRDRAGLPVLNVAQGRRIW